MDTATWDSALLRNEKPASVERVRWIVEHSFHDPALQAEIDAFIAAAGTIDTTRMESIYLDAAVKFYLASPELTSLFPRWHEQLPPAGVIVHYGTSSGTESAWLLHQAPERIVLQVDGNDAAVGSGQRKLLQVSQGRATDYASIKRQPWTGPGLGQGAFADGAIIHRVPPFPLENRLEMLKRAFADLKPGARLVLVEPNLESGGNPHELEDFVFQIARCSALGESSMTEFDLAIVARVKQRCLNEVGFHLFQAQMTSYFLTTDEVVTFCERIGFHVVVAGRALHGRDYQLVLEKPASNVDLAERFTEDLSIHVTSENFMAEIVPRRHQVGWDPDCRDHYKKLAVGQMLTRRYGLEDITLLSANMSNFDAHIVIGFHERKTGDLAAMARLIPFYDLRGFEGLKESVRRTCLSRRVMGISIYYEDCVRGKRTRELEIFRAMISCWVNLHQRGQLDAVYGEIKVEQRATYEKLGFRQIGEEFAVEGWSGSWVPMLLDLKHVSA